MGLAREGEATSQRRRSRPAWPTALALAAATNLALLSLIAFPGRYLLPSPPASGARPIDISLVALSVFRPSRPTSGIPPLGPSSRPTQSLLTAPGPTTATAQVGAPTLGEGPPAALNVAGLAAALRRGPVGCANGRAAWMSDADRDACRERLAAGAAEVPHLESMAPQKLAYYAAVAKAEEDWRTGRDPGHLPFFFCGVRFGQGRSELIKPGPHALKLGPCYLEPPKGALSQDVDVPPP